MVGLKPIIMKLGLKFWRRFLESDQKSNPLIGDRCIEYAFVVKGLASLDKKVYKKVLDMGCFASPLTTIIKEIGFTVEGIDLLPAPYIYEGVNHFQSDFLAANLRNSSYDVVVLCSTVEHIGLGGRYGSLSVKDGDVRALEKTKQILRPNGILVLTVPYGKEKTIEPLHRVYNKNSKLLRFAYDNFKVITEEFYKNNKENKWVKCDENKAAQTVPSKNYYALGLFVFRKN